MDWSAFLTALLTSIVGTGAMIALAIFLGKKWLVTRIAESVKHEYATKLEEHKADLQEQVHRSIQDMKAGFQEALDKKAVDKALFAKFFEVLPSSGCIELVATFSTSGGLFNRKSLEPLETFLREWGMPERQFLDPEIDQKRERLHTITGKYLLSIYENTSPVNSTPGHCSVSPELKAREPDRFREVVSEIRDLEEQLVAAHRDLVETARRKLIC